MADGDLQDAFVGFLPRKLQPRAKAIQRELTVRKVR
jgi:hypothetical protein